MIETFLKFLGVLLSLGWLAFWFYLAWALLSSVRCLRDIFNDGKLTIKVEAPRDPGDAWKYGGGNDDE